MNRINWWRVIRNNLAGAITTFYGLAFVASICVGESQMSFAVVTITALWLWHQMLEDDRLNDSLEKRLKRLESEVNDE